MNNSISQSFKDHPINNLNHIVPLDFQTVLKLPQSHTWRSTRTSLSPDYPPVNPCTKQPVPIIDLTNPHVTKLIRDACENWGMFQVTNHGIPLSLMKEVEGQTRRLFALPSKQKLLAVRSPDGLTGYGLPRISTFFVKMMWSEGFSIMGSPLDHATQLWPHDHAKFCDVMEKYQKEMKVVAERLMGLMLTSLDLEVAQEDLKWLKPKSPQALLQLNSYPICPDPDRTMGLAPHTDSSLLTLLYQSNTNGLQILKDDSIGWVPVDPVNGALVVNVGDLMHIVSNGRFKSALHRAVVNKTRHRISIAYFYGPPREVKISPLMKLIDYDHPPVYRAVTWKEYLDAKAVHFNRALEMIKI
ncbi:gibberellin 3-beta-dioxygenase 3-like [Tripterygium wilfordii]|uniref:gibberellin 3beta-dioxygenase n=1 Tax=Tripterygium wilfordii TaxID=458696 RepID=A0A7J7DR91_TRIWF|nr:gibberellin 3-beta-dioxygenase 3-like [Tripterygium wilfordii]KAF5748626.1 gibberellin 3-beta-dioxygenase 3-like [Tripterygium wilfordii]